MFWHWWKQQNSMQIIGLDIGPESIKLLKINSAEKPYSIENFSISPTPQGAVAKGQLVDLPSIANTLKNMLKKSGDKSKSVALAIPCGAAIIKNITLDNRLTANEIEERAWIEANRHFPDLVGDIYLDFAILGPSANDAAQIEVMLVACRKDQINPYLEICKLSGLTAKIIDINSNALERMLSEMVKSKPALNTCAILNLDISLSTLVVIQKDNLLYAHDQTFDGYRLIEHAKGYPANPESASTETYLSHLKETLSAHLRHTMHFLYSSRPNIKIDEVIVSGDCASVPMLASFVQQEIGVTTSIANPFSGWALAKEVDEQEFRRNAPALALSGGLALSLVKPEGSNEK